MSETRLHTYTVSNTYTITRLSYIEAGFSTIMAEAGWPVSQVEKVCALIEAQPPELEAITLAIEYDGKETDPAEEWVTMEVDWKKHEVNVGVKGNSLEVETNQFHTQGKGFVSAYLELALHHLLNLQYRNKKDTHLALAYRFPDYVRSNPKRMDEIRHELNLNGTLNLPKDKVEKIVDDSKVNEISYSYGVNGTVE